jgi:hypothetical protein
MFKLSRLFFIYHKILLWSIVFYCITVKMIQKCKTVRSLYVNYINFTFFHGCPINIITYFNYIKSMGLMVSWSHGLTVSWSHISSYLSRPLFNVYKFLTFFLLYPVLALLGSLCTLYWLYCVHFPILVHLSDYIIICCPIIISAPFHKSRIVWKLILEQKVYHLKKH